MPRRRSSSSSSRSSSRSSRRSRSSSRSSSRRRSGSRRSRSSSSRSSSGGKWIQKAIKHKGALHRALGIPEGKKIPKDLIKKAAATGSPKVKKMANLALTLSRFHR